MSDMIADNAGQTPASGAAEAARDTAATADAWLGQVPENWRQYAKSAGSLEKMESALKRGLAHTPVSGPDEVEIPLPEGVTPEQANLGWFKDVAAKEGFSKSQITALVGAFNQQLTGASSRMMEVAEKTIRETYGEATDAKISIGMEAVKRLDGMCDGAMTRMCQSGLGNNPDFVRAMVAIGEAMSDSDVPGFGLGGDSQEMTTEAYLREIFENAKK